MGVNRARDQPRPVYHPTPTPSHRQYQTARATVREDAPLEVPRQRGRTCNSCMTERPRQGFPRMRDWPTCNHEQMHFCRECLAHQINARIGTSGFDQIPCPQPGCPARLNSDQMLVYTESATLERYLTWVDVQAVRASDYPTVSHSQFPAVYGIKRNPVIPALADPPAVIAAGETL